MSYLRIGSDGRPLVAPTLAAFHDEKTGLMWAAKDISEKEMTWNEGKKTCSDLRLAGFSDWRMPTRLEWETLLDLSRSNPAADPALGLKSAYYWSSTPYAASPSGYAWSVHFHHGHCDYNGQNDKFFVRAVRSAGQ